MPAKAKEVFEDFEDDKVVNLPEKEGQMQFDFFQSIPGETVSIREKKWTGDINVNKDTFEKFLKEFPDLLKEGSVKEISIKSSKKERDLFRVIVKVFDD